MLTRRALFADTIKPLIHWFAGVKAPADLYGYFEEMDVPLVRHSPLGQGFGHWLVLKGGPQSLRIDWDVNRPGPVRALLDDRSAFKSERYATLTGVVQLVARAFTSDPLRQGGITDTLTQYLDHLVTLDQEVHVGLEAYPGAYRLMLVERAYSGEIVSSRVFNVPHTDDDVAYTHIWIADETDLFKAAYDDARGHLNPHLKGTPSSARKTHYRPGIGAYTAYHEYQAGKEHAEPTLEVLTRDGPVTIQRHRDPDSPYEYVAYHQDQVSYLDETDLERFIPNTRTAVC